MKTYHKVLFVLHHIKIEFRSAHIHLFRSRTVKEAAVAFRD
jgi:hypothetical protein